MGIESHRSRVIIMEFLKNNTLKGIIVLLIIGVIISGCIKQSKITEIEQRFSEFKTKFEVKKAQGYDVTEAEGFERDAKKALDKKENRRANELLDKAFNALENAKIANATIQSTPQSASVSPITGQGEARKRLSQVKVAAEYYRITDTRVIGRSDEDSVKILKEMKADLVRGWWGWKPIPESPTEKVDIISNKNLKTYIESGYTYEDLRNAITLFKNEMPNSIFMGSVGVQFLPRANGKERDPVTLETINENTAWAMAMDPTKWKIQESKEQLQCIWAKSLGDRLSKDFDCSNFRKESVEIYLPDMTNEDWQKLFLNYVKKQIDSGADAIWIDMYLKPIEVIIGAVCREQGSADISTCNLEKAAQNPAVKETTEAARKLVDEIHAYGLSKGRYIYVGSWGPRGEKAGAAAGGTIQESVPSLSPPDYDFVVTTLSRKEILDRKPDKERWDAIIETQKKVFKDIPLFVWWDTGYKNSPTHIFSQKLTPEEQREFLKVEDEYLSSRGLIFFYPVHGPLMAPWDLGEEKILSYGTYPIYDALAPEFQTYETIKYLSLKKTG